MGIHGIYQEIGSGRRVALSKLSSELYVANNRPFRLAIDIAIWLFQIQSGKGGTNPALRTFYYRLVRLLSLNIHPIFVFDGPNKPKMKRNKRVGGPGVKVSSVPEFLAKQLLKHFAFPMHFAPGEAEAECALLQREGIVDAVLSEDVDTLMFGSGMTLRSWTPEKGKSGKTPTHVNVYNADITKRTSGLDREGMVLVAMMSGGDYIPEGIPGCGPKLACEAAKAGFGIDLCKLNKSDKDGIREWRERLKFEVRTNTSNFFKQKRTALTIPDDFPNMEVLGYYTNPAISTPDKLQKLRDTLKWDTPIDFPSLRDFANDAFDWRCIGGAKQFIRKIAPAILTRELRLRGEAADTRSDDLEAQEASEATLINAVHSQRNHASTDSELELKVSFVPVNLINIDLSIEDPDEETPVDDSDSEQELPLDGDASPKKKRGPSTYDPTAPAKEWFLATFVKIGAPLKVQDYEAQFNDPRKFATRNAPKASKPRKKVAAKDASMPVGALERFAVPSKSAAEVPARKPPSHIDEVDLSGSIESTAQTKKVSKAKLKPAKHPDIRGFSKVVKPGVDRTDKQKASTIEELDLSAVHALHEQSNPPRFAAPATLPQNAYQERRPAKRRSPEPVSPYPGRTLSPPRKVMKQPDIIEILSSSPQRPPSRNAIQRTPERSRLRQMSAQADDMLNSPLPDTVTRRRRRSPLKRHRTAPVSGEDLDMEVHDMLPSPRSTHNTIEAIDLASPVPVFPRSPESSQSLPSPSMLRSNLVSTQAMTAAEIRPASRTEKGPETITEWIRRSQSVTPGKSRFVDRLTKTTAVAPTIVEETIIDVHSSMPTPPIEHIELDEADEHFLRKSPPAITTLREGNAPERTAISVGALLPSTRYLRDRPGSANKTSRIDDAVLKSDHVPVPGTARDVNTTSKPGKGKSKKKYVQPRESLPGAWKYVEEVDLSGTPDESYRRAFRMSEVEMLDLTED